MHDAIKILSADKLNVRILAEKEDPDSPEGIIISQTPAQGKKIKPQQSVFLVITRKPPRIQAPSLCGLPLEDAKKKAAQARIALQTHAIESSYPKDNVIAQNKLPGEELIDKTMTLSVSAGDTPLRIMPDLRGKKAEEVVRFLKPFNIKVEVTHPDQEKDHVCSSCLIIDQRPHVGSIIDLAKAPVVQLTTQKLEN
jgi:serine/threonine-protein kinase